MSESVSTARRSPTRPVTPGMERVTPKQSSKTAPLPEFAVNPVIASTATATVTMATKVAFVVYGIARSINVTAPMFAAQIERLQASGLTVDSIAFVSDVGSVDRVDGCVIRTEDWSAAPYAFFEMITQPDVDKAIEDHCASQRCRFHNRAYAQSTQRNALRQMYLEYRAGMYLKNFSHEYSVAIVIGSDIVLGSHMSADFVVNISLPANRDVVFITDTNDGIASTAYQKRLSGRSACTDGMYVGQPTALVPMLTRLDRFDRLHATFAKGNAGGDVDYEGLLRTSIVESGMHNRIMSMPIWKIRAYGSIIWFGPLTRFNSNKVNQTFRTTLMNSIGRQWPWTSVPNWVFKHSAEEVNTALRAFRQLIDPVAPACQVSHKNAWELCAWLSPQHRALLSGRRCNTKGPSTSTSTTILHKAHIVEATNTQIDSRQLNASPASSASRCFTQSRDFREPINGEWVPMSSASESRTERVQCPFRRAWETCEVERVGVSGTSFVTTGCSLAPFKAGRLLEKLAGRRLMFVGDSVHVQMAVAFACALFVQKPGAFRNSSLKYNLWKPLKKRCGSTPLARCHWEAGCIYFAGDVTICSRFVFNIGDEGRVDTALAGLSSTDIVVYGSVGLHYREAGPHRNAVLRAHAQESSYAPRLAALEANTLLQSMLKLPLVKRPFLVWREVTAQHFSVAGGHYTGSFDYNELNQTHTCVRHTPAVMAEGNRWNPTANALMEAYGVPILRVWASTQQAHFHIHGMAYIISMAP